MSDFFSIYHEPCVGHSHFAWSHPPPREIQQRRDAILMDLQTWACHFEKDFKIRPPSPTDQIIRLTLKAQHTIIHILASTLLAPSASAFDMHTDDFCSVVLAAEQALLLRQLLPPSTATAELGIAFPLYKTAMHAPDVMLRLRAADLLAQCGLEGCWNGPLMAAGSRGAMSVLERWRMDRAVGGGINIEDLFHERVYGDNLENIYTREKVWTFRFRLAGERWVKVNFITRSVSSARGVL